MGVMGVLGAAGNHGDEVISANSIRLHHPSIAAFCPSSLSLMIRIPYSIFHIPYCDRPSSFCSSPLFEFFHIDSEYSMG